MENEFLRDFSEKVRNEGVGELLSYLEDEKNFDDICNLIFQIPNSTNLLMNLIVTDSFLSRFLSKKSFADRMSQYLSSSFSCCSCNETSVSRPLQIFNEILDDDQPMKGYFHYEFNNRGNTVKNTPQYTFFPTTKLGIQNIVRFAKSKSLTVRVGGYRQTCWNDFYSSDDQVFISLLPVEVTDQISIQKLQRNRNNPFMDISLVEIDGTKALCKIGPAVTNEMFREWANQNGYTVPFNVIPTQNTFGGTNALLCHGSGLRHGTVSDMVREIEFVNFNGDIQKVTDPALLRAAGGCFGILGPVTSLTLELHEMTYAVMKPMKINLPLAIPPPCFDESYIPQQLSMNYSYSRLEMENAFEEFCHAAENNYFCEYIWFAYSDKCYVNTWQNDGEKQNSKPYPSEFLEASESLGAFLSTITNHSDFKRLPGGLQAKIISSLSMASLPTYQQTTSVADALHFQRGIQNLKVRNFELEIPLTRYPDGSFDWNVTQLAWWDLIKLVYDTYPIDDPEADTPFRLSLELRIMGGSQMLMAPQSGFDGTCSLLIKTPENVNPEEWNHFIQQVCDMWLRYDYKGVRLRSRPHWAKQWPEAFDGVDSIDFLRERYSEELPLFFDGLAIICATEGYTVDDLQMFCSPLMLELFSPFFPGLNKDCDQTDEISLDI
jgi:hypothetical protein